MRTIVALPMLAFAWNAGAAPEHYKIDDTHSFANWGIRHVVGRTTGTFTDVTGTMVLDPSNPNTGAANVSISVYSLQSGHRPRDVHLLTSDFLDANTYPEMRFVASRFRSTGKNAGVMSGQLTLHGASRQVDIPYRILGSAVDPWGHVRIAFEGKFTLNRSDYGVTKYVDGGSGMVGNEVDITLLVEALKLGADGQPVNMKAPTASPPAAAPAQPPPATAPAGPGGKPDLKDMLRGIFK
jgi:polyisoprenoid-binding protein YceI